MIHKVTAALTAVHQTGQVQASRHDSLHMLQLHHSKIDNHDAQMTRILKDMHSQTQTARS